VNILHHLMSLYDAQAERRRGNMLSEVLMNNNHKLLFTNSESFTGCELLQCECHVHAASYITKLHKHIQ